MKNASELLAWGVRYLPPGETHRVDSPENALYSYRVFHGDAGAETLVEVPAGDCGFFVKPAVSRPGFDALRIRGPYSCAARQFSCIVRGYAPDDAERSLVTPMSLPYVNGCSTKEIFPPERAGDPTLQMLTIPPYSKEQAHHIHSTARVVAVLSGRGDSVVGMEGKTITTELVPGMTVVLDPMCPHHFETPQGEPLVVAPVHVWSTGRGEFDHPMYRGTHMMNQGE